MKTYREVAEHIKQLKNSGVSKGDFVVSIANDCIGWPYVYAGRGEQCTPENRRDFNNSKKVEDIKTNCKNFDGNNGCGGCEWYPGGTVLFYDCRGFTYWLFKLVDITILGKGATSQYDDNNNWSEKGLIKDMPKNQVCCVFRYDNNTGKMEHTLLYDGNGSYIHCSGKVKKVSVSKYNATHYAIPKGLKQGGVTPVPEPSTETTAVVYAENGKPVKMRAKPNTSCKTYWEIPCGTEVTVIKQGDEWTQINDGKHSGYMMSKFLKYGTPNEEKPVTDLVTVCIPNLTKDEANELLKQYSEAYMTVG